MEEIFKKYSKRLTAEAILKSIVCGLSIGLFVGFVVAFVTWFVDFKGIWLALVISIAVLAISATVFYFALFRPTEKDVARRLDALGLEERNITMLELKDDSSYIAACQINDTKEKLGKISSKMIKFLIPTAAILTAAIISVPTIGMATVKGLHDADIVPSGSELLGLDEIALYGVNYITSEAGVIINSSGDLVGETKQTVEEGGSADKVVATDKVKYDDKDWMFFAWSDGVTDPSRKDSGIDGDIKVTAIFTEVAGIEIGEDVGDESTEGPRTKGEPGDKSGESGDTPGLDDPDLGNNPGEDGDGAGGSRDDERNQIEDESTYYRDLLNQTYNSIMQKIASGEGVSDEERAFLEAYFKIIA